MYAEVREEGSGFDKLHPADRVCQNRETGCASASPPFVRQRVPVVYTVKHQLNLYYVQLDRLKTIHIRGYGLAYPRYQIIPSPPWAPSTMSRPLVDELQRQADTWDFTLRLCLMLETKYPHISILSRSWPTKHREFANKLQINSSNSFSNTVMQGQSSAVESKSKKKYKLPGYY